jgi:hypothetical protein
MGFFIFFNLAFSTVIPFDTLLIPFVYHMKYSLGIARKQKVKEKKIEQKSVIFTPCNAPGARALPYTFMCTFLSHFTCDKEMFFRFIYAREKGLKIDLFSYT